MQAGSLFAAAALLFALVSAAQSCTHVWSVVNGVGKSLKRGHNAPRRAHKGCYVMHDKEHYTSKTGSVNYIEDLTWEKCRDQCYGPNMAATNKDEVIGLQDKNCWCFHQFDPADHTVDSECNIECPGDKQQFCGGSQYISVYSSGYEEGMSGR